MTEKPAVPGKSWTIQKVHGKWSFIRSHWAPGYTPLHTSDQGSAKKLLLLKLNGQLAALQADILAVQELAFICTSGCDDARPPDGPGVDPNCPVHGWA